jgi:hypothetical protein
MFILNKKEAEKKALAITSEGMHFKGQYLPKESFNILGKKVKIICKAYSYVILVEYKNQEFFISEDLINKHYENSNTISNK